MYKKNLRAAKPVLINNLCYGMSIKENDDIILLRNSYNGRVNMKRHGDNIIYHFFKFESMLNKM